MIKIIGAVLIIAAASAVGISGSMRLRSRVAALASVQASLLIMECEICDRLTSLPELLKLLSEGAPEPCRKLFRNCLAKMELLGINTFSAIWRGAVFGTPELELTTEERETLAQLGGVIGRYDSEEQRSALKLCGKLTESYKNRAIAERDSKSKLYGALGLTAGLAMVIILI